VIEARGISLHDPTIEPFVVVKLNGSSFNQKSTNHKLGIQWWDKTLSVKVTNVDYDWIAVELREKGYHILNSDWIGELQFKVREFQDGAVHQDWYQLQKSAVKRHSKPPRGFIHLAFQLLTSKSERPFAQIKDIPFDEWQFRQPKEPQEPAAITTELVLTQTIQESEYQIGKHSTNILMTENPTDADVHKMQSLNKVNCLHKGNFESCQGKKIMVAVDGSSSSNTAFEHALKLMDPKKDHLFIVTVRERLATMEWQTPRNRTILTHKIWQAASQIITKYQAELGQLNIEYTSIMPEADDARDLVCRIITRYNIDILVVGKHKRNETKTHTHRVRSFAKYCQGNAKCSVLVY